MQYNIQNFTSLASTQKALIETDIKEYMSEGSVFVTSSQTKGKGQATNVWESEDGKNLTFSLLLRPSFIKPPKQFSLTQILSLAIVDCLSRYVNEEFIKIKWSNDIYIKQNKICGILIQNSIMGSEFSKAICGIGLNVNQIQFKHAPNPTSLTLETGKSYNLSVLLSELLNCIEARYESFHLTPDLNEQYLSRLLYINELRTYIYKGKRIRAKITGVNLYGSLCLECMNGEMIEAEQKEVLFCH